MNLDDVRLSLWDLVSPISRTVDMMAPALAEHHMRVAYLAMRIGEELGFPQQTIHELVIAGALHDIGAFSVKNRLDLLAFEDHYTHPHCKAGYLLLNGFKPFADIGPIILYHHLPWNHGQGLSHQDKAVPETAHILHLADRVAVMLRRDVFPLSQVQEICEAVAQAEGKVFAPKHVGALMRFSEKDYIWLEAASKFVEAILRKRVGQHIQIVQMGELLGLARLICNIIDFKSEFTATHSSGVAATAVSLARRIGFSDQECAKIEIAAYLHDLGKLAIPSEILEKPGKLTPEEWHIMRSHVYYTYHILESIEPFGDITPWAALHQERLDGSGYPFKYTAADLPLGARVMAIADVFTSITENRPYHAGRDKDEAVRILRDMADHDKLDAPLVEMLLRHFEEINTLRIAAQTKALKEYQDFQAALAA
ncbi:MAG TPA: HD domain-containing protein [Candidatus Hydrogenedentes bacterium]|nr:HD domain-containing protein [Candidatus Hydrogenedentota bacterium]HOV75484.1 HD domain-containing protein [Candidatus Hydrogenedentota bacterium]